MWDEPQPEPIKGCDASKHCRVQRRETSSLATRQSHLTSQPVSPHAPEPNDEHAVIAYLLRSGCPRTVTADNLVVLGIFWHAGQHRELAKVKSTASLLLPDLMLTDLPGLLGMAKALLASVDP